MDIFLFFVGGLTLLSSIGYLVVSALRKNFVGKVFFSLFFAGVVLSGAGLAMGIANDAQLAEEETKEVEKERKVEGPKEDPKVVEKPEEEPEEPKKEEPKEESPKSFNYTVESFTTAVNDTYASVDSDVTVSPVLKEEENAAVYMITTNTAIITHHGENGMINEVDVLFMMEDSTDLDSINFLLAAGVVIGVLNPELVNEERGDVLIKELSFMELLDKDEGYETAFVGSNLYKLTSSRSIGGVQLKVTPSEDI